MMTSQNKTNAKILIVDDYEDQRHILSQELQPIYQVMTATDGPQALKRVAESRPDLILLDVVMPGMSGYEVCRRLKANKDTRDIPIIFITVKHDELDETDGFALGAADYITKPFHLAVVRARVATILNLKKEIDSNRKLAVNLKKLNEHLEDKVEEQVADLRIAHEEAKASEERLRQAHKMEAIGTLAGGIAHDFNNILSAIVGYTELTKNDVHAGSESEQYLANVLKASARAKDLVNQILIFSRETEQGLKSINISIPIEEVLRLIRAMTPATIEIFQDIQDQIAAMADIAQIHQLMMNLCSNAACAMREKGGTLTIKLKDEKITSEMLSQYPDLCAGSYAKLTVSDTGHGIAPDIIDRIYDPFFTTRGKSDGSGMGLAVVHGIIKNHKGAIYVASQVNKGTTFTVFLPLLERRSVRRENHVISPTPGGDQTILIVDDEEMLVDMEKSVLEKLGYKIFGETSPIEALNIFQEDPDKFDLIVTDMTMPNMTGLDLAKKIRQLRPKIPIILITGHGIETTGDIIAKQGIDGIIFKPVLPREFAEKIQTVLDHSAALESGNQPLTADR